MKDEHEQEEEEEVIDGDKTGASSARLMPMSARLLVHIPMINPRKIWLFLGCWPSFVHPIPLPPLLLFLFAFAYSSFFSSRLPTISQFVNLAILGSWPPHKGQICSSRTILSAALLSFRWV